MKTILYLVFFSMPVAFINAQDGLPDSSFGKNGVVTTDFKYDTWANAVAVQQDGKIIAVGGRQDGINFFQVIRYLKNGKPDISFGKYGKATVYIQNHFYAAEPFAVALQRDGKVLVAGVAENVDNDADFAIVRLNANGTPDSLFGNKGSATANLGYFYEKGRSLVVQPDGKIVVTGWGEGRFETVRFNTNGILDSGFGSNGGVITSVGNLGGTAYTVGLEPDGKIVVSGTVNGGFGIVRYLQNGQLDSSFGINGSVVSYYRDGDEIYGYAMTIQPDGKIIMGGPTFQNSDAILARYKMNGSIDSSFGFNGRVLVKGPSFSFIYALCLQHDNKIVAAGSTFISNDTRDDYSVWRFNVNGKPDSSFANNGVALIDYNKKIDDAYGVAVTPDNKIVVTGAMSKDFGVAVYGTIRLTNEGHLIAVNKLNKSLFSFSGMRSK